MSAPAAKNTPDEPILGMDYGVPPRYMLMANPALMELWNQAKCLAFGYGQLPKHGAFFDVPFVGIVFEDIEKGIRVFELLKSWDCEPGSGQGTDISFLENQDTNSYTMALGPNYAQMIKRLLHPSMLEDYSLMTMGLAVGKTLTISENFRRLRDQSRNKPIVFVPATKTGEVLAQHALTKPDVQFYQKENVPRDSLIYAMTVDDPRSIERSSAETNSVDPVQIQFKRTRQLKKFFAVTIARLEHNPTFAKVVQGLNQNYDRWQLVQAACNILSADRNPSLVEANGKLDFNKAYDAIRHNSESPTDEVALHKQFNGQAIESQIAEDEIYLYNALRLESKEGDPVMILRRLGLIR